MKWEYLAALHTYQKKDKDHQNSGWFFLFKDSGQESTLDDGLNLLGQQGWELAGVQPWFQQPDEGDVLEDVMNRRLGKPASYIFTTLYIFKRPVKTE